jgi:hypothetical protein
VFLGLLSAFDSRHENPLICSFVQIIPQKRAVQNTCQISY